MTDLAPNLIDALRARISALETDAKHMREAHAQLVRIHEQDIVAHRQLEAALRESEARFRQVAETIQQVFYITSVDHEQVLYISPAYEKQWGRTCESLYAQPRSWFEAIHAEDRPGVFEQVGAGPVDGRYECEYRMIRPDGSVRWILDRAYELRDADNRPYRIIGVAEDISERRRLERQLREAQKMEVLGQLAGGVAHDFNNLVTIILCNVTLMQEATLADAAQNGQLEDVRQAATRAGELTRKLLGFSRRAPLDLQGLDLRVTVRETAGLLQRTVDPRIRIAVDEPDTLGSVLADPGEMSQVVLNLCLNARDAMPEGGTLFIRTRAVLVSEDHARECVDARPGETICLTVQDSGSGIAPEVQSRIFEPFFTTKQPGTGTGLGLAVAFGTVKQHRGWIEFTSEVGRGTRFDVYLPLHHGVARERAAASQPGSSLDVGGTILLVDDEAAIRSIAAKMLGECGYHVLLAEDGPEAIRIFGDRWRAIDLVILDLRMPKLSGRDTLQTIRQIDPGARVLVTSGHSDEYQRALESGSLAGCLRKPWTLNDLAAAVRSALAPGPVT